MIVFGRTNSYEHVTIAHFGLFVNPCWAYFVLKLANSSIRKTRTERSGLSSRGGPSKLSMCVREHPGSQDDLHLISIELKGHVEHACRALCAL